MWVGIRASFCSDKYLGSSDKHWNFCPTRKYLGSILLEQGIQILSYLDKYLSNPNECSKFYPNRTEPECYITWDCPILQIIVPHLKILENGTLGKLQFFLTPSNLLNILDLLGQKGTWRKTKKGKIMNYTLHINCYHFQITKTQPPLNHYLY